MILEVYSFAVESSELHTRTHITKNPSKNPAAEPEPEGNREGCETVMNGLVHKVNPFFYHSAGNFVKDWVRYLTLLVSEAFRFLGVSSFDFLAFALSILVL